MHGCEGLSLERFGVERRQGPQLFQVADKGCRLLVLHNIQDPLAAEPTAPGCHHPPHLLVAAPFLTKNEDGLLWAQLDALADDVHKLAHSQV